MSVDAWLTIGILALIFITLLATKLPPAAWFMARANILVLIS